MTDPRMQVPFICKTVQRLLQAVCLGMVFLLTGCDGGLFGTGDGSDTGDILIDASTADSMGPTGGGIGAENGDSMLGNLPSSTDVPPDPTSGNPVEVAPDADSLPSLGSFDNTQIASLQDDALLSVINVTDQAVSLDVTSSLSEATVTFDVEAGQVRAATVIPTGSSVLTVLPAMAGDTIDAQDRPLFRIESLTAGASSLTTLVIRNRVFNDSVAGVEALPLRSEVGSGDNGVARVRVIQTSELRNRDTGEDSGVAQTRTAIFELRPAGSNPGGGAVSFADVSFVNPVTDYLSVAAGDYELVDSESRLVDQAVQLEGGISYTLVIRGADESVLTHRDEDRSTQGN